MCDVADDNTGIDANTGVGGVKSVDISDLMSTTRALASWPERRTSHIGFVGYGNTTAGNKVLIAVDREYDPAVPHAISEALREKGAHVDRMEEESLKSLETKSVEAVARATGKSPVDTFFDTWLRDDLRSRFLYKGLANGNMEILADMIKSPQGLIGTDAGAHLNRFFWHGTTARILGYWCREKKLFPLEEAVWKLTGHPASKLRLNRGHLKLGWPADITVFDPDQIKDLVSDRLPEKVDSHEVHRHPPGVGAVVVNGEVVVEEGRCLDVFPGKVTRQELCIPGL